MVEEFTVTDFHGTITFNRTNSDFLIDDNGLDWGEVNSTFSTIPNFNGMGSELNAVQTTDIREIHLVGWVVGTPAQMSSKKTLLSEIISPQKPLRIQVSGYYMDVYLSKAVSFGKTEQTNNEKMCQFEMTFAAVYPFFQRSVQYNISSSGTINNRGSIPVGAKITLSANGASNPYVVIDDTASGLGLLGSFSGQAVMDTKNSKRELKLNGVKDYSMLASQLPWAYIPVGTSSVRVSGGSAVIEFDEAYATLEDL